MSAYNYSRSSQSGLAKDEPIYPSIAGYSPYRQKLVITDDEEKVDLSDNSDIIVRVHGKIDMRFPEGDAKIQRFWITPRLKGQSKQFIFKFLLTFYSRDDHFQQALTEWDWVIVQRTEDPSFCFCSQQEIMVRFLIRNRYNDNVLRVGSTHILEFIDQDMEEVIERIKRWTDTFDLSAEEAIERTGIFSEWTDEGDY